MSLRASRPSVRRSTSSRSGATISCRWSATCCRGLRTNQSTSTRASVFRSTMSPRASRRMCVESPRASVTKDRVLTKANIAAAVETAVEDRRRRTEATADNVVKELARIAFFDIRVLFDDHGRLRPVTDLAHEHAAVIASLDLVTHKVGGGDVDYVHRIRLRDKVHALEL